MKAVNRFVVIALSKTETDNGLGVVKMGNSIHCYVYLTFAFNVFLFISS